MRPRNNRHARLELERLDGRLLLTAGLNASLSRGILSIVGTSADSPIVVDVLAARTRRGVAGVVTVEGVASFKASQVRQVMITSVAGEEVDINRGPRWNPGFRSTVINPVSPTPPSSPPTTASPPVFTFPPSNSQPSPVNTTISLSSTMSSNEQAIVDAVNAVRAQNGLGPLQVNGQLVQMAHLQANNMAASNTMSHTITSAPQPELTDRAGYIGYRYAQLGENIAYNFSDTASVMNGWMNSSGHRANILGANYTQIGVGIAYSGNGQPYYCQVFGKPTS